MQAAPGPRAGRFFYDRFELDAAQGRIRYFYSTDKGHEFVHVLSLTVPKDTDQEALAPALFALGMAELVHYWKALLAPVIVVKAGRLSPEQIAFWVNLYTKGLGEFFYVNRIDFRDLIHIENDANAPLIPPTSSVLSRRALVAFGGGKDSILTGELLTKQRKEFTWFELEPVPFGTEVKRISGNETAVSIGRSVRENFEQVRELVESGAPNGHVPITAMYIFSATLAAKLYGFSDIVMSLERSANEGNLEYLGATINHQYSKSFEFEEAANAYVRKHIDPNIRVFSLLRPLYELQIVQKFAKYPQYFGYFISCNKGLRTGTWCGHCAKCAFIFAALSAFLPPQNVVAIFKKNLFEDDSLVPLYEELIGKGAQKPFDCVGTYEENLLALYLSGKRYEEAKLPLPPVLSKVAIAEGEKHLALLDEHSSEHLIPSDYQTP